MTDLARLGIRIEARGDRLRYSPRSAVTPDLTDRMKAHKGELLAILWQETLDRLDSDPLFPPDVLAGLRAADVDWGDSEAQEERIAIILEGCGHDPAMVLQPHRLAQDRRTARSMTEGIPAA